ncbi:retron Ec48 family effector membrane protein [Vibrio parahaemolyticus]|uniref:retron Ec48 family effector membrane protein n=1 Tax=Vibrio TaxID=662 RepID=UPI0003F68B39|nr:MULTISPECIES: retron Ec48 family effector membrane protein [Vibrio]EGQ9819862.1 hypothetical protein [Vibrio parahaemolyticus]EHK0031553.1 retron Ec48 family effector membrane protein [Vibrio parahaemolyticus]EHR6400147.1 retron Ec48 family effector membrane protein [Vibrio parahaemolyticus]EJB0383335.1 retron Ec48 family effector membrane protein [Vibrio parahaemolyticus]EJG1102833.1 retron Ec48 family effector membrane protein [Vibrio parahaemolyticus]
MKKSAIFKLIYGVIILFSIITVVTIISVIYTGYKNAYFELSFCIDDTCLSRAKSYYGNIIAFYTGSVEVLAAIATSLGIIVAAKTFKNTADTNAFNSHISHFKTFSDYLSFEVSKKDKVKLSAINVFDWFNLIFEDSISGSIDVSDNYFKALKDIENEIEKTNKKATTASNGPFRHAEHQQRMRPVFKALGIEIEHYPKNDYWIIEDELISLIDSINQAFCQRPKRVGKICSRKYFEKS